MKPNHYIIALDPGTTQTAVVVLQDGAITYHNIQPNEYVLAFLESMTAADPLPTLVIERIEGRGMPVGQEVFETCEWIGRFVQVWYPQPVEFVFRREVKSHICGSQKAKDANIRQALLDIYGPQGTKKAPGPTFGLKADEWSALAVAETFLGREKAKAA